MKTYKQVKENVYTADENFVKRAKEFYVAVAVNADGHEGVVAHIDLQRFPPVEKPLMGATIADRDSIIELARKASKEAQIKIRVLKYTACEVIEEFVPSHLN